MNRRTFLKGLGYSAALVGTGTFQREGVCSEDGKHVWRMVTSWSNILPIIQNGAEQFARKLAIMSGGRLNIQVYAGGELVKPLEVFDAVSSGIKMTDVERQVIPITFFQRVVSIVAVIVDKGHAPCPVSDQQRVVAVMDYIADGSHLFSIIFI